MNICFINCNCCLEILKRMNTAIFEMDKGRTSGDGMEEEAATNKQDVTPPAEGPENLRIKPIRPPVFRKDRCALQENIHASNKVSLTNTLPMPALHSFYRREQSVSRSLAPVIPKGELVPMTPRLVTPNTVTPEHKKNKPPKFIPYEPYPGAVNPLVPRANNIGLTKWHTMQKVNKNNLDIVVLVNQMTNMRTQELEEVGKTKVSQNLETEKTLITLQKELKLVKEQRDYFQAQFKFQANVNTELKSLLVASVGEDLQTRVNVLTEDKLQLARALLDTANNLTTHTEQIEFLAGQCEVWRSKFLASSVMVEELARWKADLTQKNNMLTGSSKQLMKAMHQLRDMQLEILKNLKFLAKIRYLNLPATDVISLSGENLNIVQQMVLHSGVGMPENLNILSASTNPLCEAEKFAEQALEFISQPLMATDEAIRALFEQTQRPYPTAMITSGLNASNTKDQ